MDPTGGFNGGFNAIVKMITKSTSVMTPLLIIMIIVLAACTMIFFYPGAWPAFTPLALIVCYSLYRYEKFSRDQPHMLSSTEVQQLGMKLGAYGSDKKVLSPTDAGSLEATTNPMNSAIEESTKEIS